VRYRTWAWLWLRELWVNAATRPMLLVPHLHRARRRPGDGFQCALCGSRSARVQRKGNRLAERMRRELA
jgi:hypothetical protein